MSEYEHAVPLCPICGGMVRAELLPKKNWDDPGRGAWTCDLHGEIAPRWEFLEEEEEREED